MRADIDPRRVRVVSVGIDRYDNPSLDTIRGVARDAANFALWAVLSGVEPESVALIASWADADEEDGCHELKTLRDQGVRYHPNGDKHAIEEELLALEHAEGSLLLLYWAGHGLAGDAGRVVFTADTKPRANRYMNIGNLQQFLRGTGFARTVLFVDACANAANRKDLGGPFDSGGLSRVSDRGFPQWTLFSAASGKYGRRSGRPESVFSGVLLDWLDAHRSVDINLGKVRTHIDAEMRKLTTSGIARGATAIQTWQMPETESATTTFRLDDVAGSREAGFLAEQVTLSLRAIARHLDDHAQRSLVGRFVAIGTAATGRNAAQVLNDREGSSSAEAIEEFARVIGERLMAAEEMFAEIFEIASEESSLHIFDLTRAVMEQVCTVASTADTVPPTGKPSGCVAVAGSPCDPSFITVIDLRKRLPATEPLLLSLASVEGPALQFAVPFGNDLFRYAKYPRMWIARTPADMSRDEVAAELNRLLQERHERVGIVGVPALIVNAGVDRSWQVQRVLPLRLEVDYPNAQSSMLEQFLAANEVGGLQQREAGLFAIRDARGLAAMLVSAIQLAVGRKASREMLRQSMARLVEVIEASD